MRSGLTAYLMISVAILLTGCSGKPETRFQELAAATSGIGFVNSIEEDEDFNILTYEYLYNGGGVAAGDLNGDGLDDLVFSGNMVPSKIYLNKGDMQFEDITASAGFSDRRKWKTGVVIADVNGDGLADIYLCYSGPGSDADRSNALYINKGVQNGVPQFEEQAAAFGLDAPGTFSTTALFFDMDNDNDLDMFLVNHADMFFNPFYNTQTLRTKRHPQFGNRLYRNDGNAFTDVSEAAGIHGSGLNFGLSVSAGDINGDGWADLYVTNDYDERDFLYLNNGNGSFREVLDKATGHISEFAMGSDIADFNNDGMADILVLDMLPEDNHRQKLLKGADTYDKYTTRVQHGFHYQQMRNTLQLNNGLDNEGVPVFSEIGQMAGIARTDWSWAPLFADFDNDGWKDIFISNGIFKDITNLDFVKYTSGYTNRKKETLQNKSEMWKLIKQMPSTPLDNYFFRNDGKLGFTNVSESWHSGKRRISNGAAYADLDNDGDLDLVINCLDDAPLLLRNGTAGNANANYLSVKLTGNGKNTAGIGAKIRIRSSSGTQYFEQFTARGFQSSVSPVIHAGLGSDSLVSEVMVEWPGGSRSVVKDIRANQVISINSESAANDSASEIDSITTAPRQMFKDVTAALRLEHSHKEGSFVDFKVSPLLPYQLSKTGPALACGDINGDGLDDIVVGGAGKQPGTSFYQRTNGGFDKAPQQPWDTLKDFHIADIHFFDADGDGDLDVYLVAGGNDFAPGSKNYQDRIYVNTGGGNFRWAPFALPEERISGSCARSADINRDGLPDLFVGGKITPMKFPVPPKSMLLVNRSTRDDLRFTIDDAQTDSTVFSPGMVTDAVFADLNNDGWPDLAVAGEFMPITIFINANGILKNATEQFATAKTHGWWSSIIATDINGDGYTDLVAGNMGTNTQLTASEREPITITYADFNGDGVIDPILEVYNRGTSYPFFTRDEVLDQMPVLQKKFASYTAYADATINDMFSSEQLRAASKVFVYTCESSIFLNREGKTMEAKPLPRQAQVSRIGGIVPADVDGDGRNELIVAGNFFPFRVQQGPLDASIGLVLKVDDDGNAHPIEYKRTGLLLKGDVRRLCAVKSGSQTLILAGKSNDNVQAVLLQPHGTEQ